jgi:predicted Fe-Mo cluster-binding NifX family protein
MKFAIPVAGGILCSHFGHCEKFAVIDVDPKTHIITKKTELIPPPHEPGVLPRWLSQNGINVVLAGGMGQRAQQLFAQQNINVVVGVDPETPEKLVNSFLSGTLRSGNNLCDH